MNKILEEELQEELLSQYMEEAKRNEGLTPELTPKQKLVRCVSGILRYMMKTYHPHLLICKGDYDEKDDTLLLSISDETFLNTTVHIKVKQTLDIVHQGRGFYNDSELRVLNEFPSCWNKVVM